MEMVTVGKMLLKHKLSTKQGKQRQRHAFVREAAVVLQFVRVVETRRKQEEEELCPHAGASPGPSPSSSAGARAPGMQCQGCSLCTCQGYCTRLVRQKASAEENTSSWTLLERGGSKGHAQVLSWIKAGFGCVKITSVCLPLLGGKAPD